MNWFSTTIYHRLYVFRPCVVTLRLTSRICFSFGWTVLDKENWWQIWTASLLKLCYPHFCWCSRSQYPSSLKVHVCFTFLFISLDCTSPWSPGSWKISCRLTSYWLTIDRSTSSVACLVSGNASLGTMSLNFKGFLQIVGYMVLSFWFNIHVS